MALFFKKHGPELPPAPQRPVIQTEPKHISYLELPPPSPTQGAAAIEAQPEKMPEFPPLPREDIPPSVPPLTFKSDILPARPAMMQQQRRDLFVDVAQYSSVLDELDKLKTIIAKGQDTMNEIMSMKSEEDAELDRWRNVLEDMERKLLWVDKTLFER